MTKLVFIGTETTTDQDGTFITEKYETADYIIYKTIYIWGKGKSDTTFSIDTKTRDGYMPEVFFEHSSIRNDKKDKFKIQTTAYGSKDPEDIEKVIEGYQKALELVKTLTDLFIGGTEE